MTDLWKDDQWWHDYYEACVEWGLTPKQAGPDAAATAKNTILDDVVLKKAPPGSRHYYKGKLPPFSEFREAYVPSRGDVRIVDHGEGMCYECFDGQKWNDERVKVAPDLEDPTVRASFVAETVEKIRRQVGDQFDI